MITLAVAVTVAIRVGILVVSPSAFRDDPDAYRAIALTVAEHRIVGLQNSEGLPRATAFRPPLYPLLLSSVCTRGELPGFRVGLIHVVIAALTTLLIFDSTLRLATYSGVHFGRIRRSGLAAVASLIVAVDPILLRQSSEVMTETFATLLSAAVFWGWIRLVVASDSRRMWPRAAVLGLLLGLAYLCRPPFLAWAVLICMAILAAGFRGALWSRKKSWIAASLTAGMCALAVVAWTMRNSTVMGHPIWATSHGGYTLLLANNDLFYDHLETSPFGNVWDADGFLNAYEHRYDGDPRDASFWRQAWDQPPRVPESANASEPVTEHSDDKLCAEAALATIRRRPATFVWSCVVRAIRLWSPLPHMTQNRSIVAIILVSGFYVVLYAAVCVGAWRHRGAVFSKPWWSMWLLIFTLTAVHSIYWSNLRMRAPAIPALAMIAIMAAGTSNKEPAKA
ncbi:MAG: hypothetical protein AAFX06_15770 [Planctomycetota bacterium]